MTSVAFYKIENVISLEYLHFSIYLVDSFAYNQWTRTQMKATIIPLTCHVKQEYTENTKSLEIKYFDAFFSSQVCFTTRLVHI